MNKNLIKFRIFLNTLAIDSELEVVIFNKAKELLFNKEA